jgi:drug/metabolite transporter (DMT)-like permease
MQYALLIFGVFCCSTSVIFIKIGTTDPVALSAYRLLIGGGVLIPLALRRGSKQPGVPLQRLLARTLPPAVFLALHFVTWILGARLTPSANASLIVNMVPAVMPVLLLLVVREGISRWEFLGTVVALSGVVLLGMSDLDLSREHLLGDAVCFLSMILYALYLVCARRNRDLPSLYEYVVHVYILAGLICLSLAGLLQLMGRPVIWLGPNAHVEWISILGLALVPTVLGHSIVNWAFRHIRGQTVVVLNLAQFVFAGILGFLLLQEVPSPALYPASLLVVCGALIVIYKLSRGQDNHGCRQSRPAADDP